MAGKVQVKQQQDGRFMVLWWRPWRWPMMATNVLARDLTEVLCVTGATRVMVVTWRRGAMPHEEVQRGK